VLEAKEELAKAGIIDHNPKGFLKRRRMGGTGSTESRLKRICKRKREGEATCAATALSQKSKFSPAGSTNAAFTCKAVAHRALEGENLV
jgi:hypothetical protein